MSAPTKQSTCSRRDWYGSVGKSLRSEGWRLRKVAPKWDVENALIERSENAESYVRFSLEEVAVTKLIYSGNCIVTVDLDEKGKPIGVELIKAKVGPNSETSLLAKVTAERNRYEKALRMAAEQYPAEIERLKAELAIAKGAK